MDFDAANIEPVFQPIVDLRDGSVVGYEALARGRNGDGPSSPSELFAAARELGKVGELDRACREAALASAQAAGLGAPFCLFINADAGALEDDVPGTPLAGFTMVMEVSESSLTERPEPLLRALTELRRRGWGVALDDVGGDSRSLALMPVLYPDVIKLDLRLLRDREPHDIARIVTAVGAEAEQRLATVLAEGIDSDEQLAMARAVGATLGQGFLLGEPAPLPEVLPKPGRALRLTSSGGAPADAIPYQRVTNWRRPAQGSLELAEHAASLATNQAAALGSTGMLLVSVPDDGVLPDGQMERYAALAEAASASWRCWAAARRRPPTARSAAARSPRATRCAAPGPRSPSARATASASSPSSRRTAAGASPPPTTARPWSSARWC